ncbi:Na+/H+ antiporter subunit E [Myxococcus stipitatus]|uniref:Na+/H+ antiporter subunit E n=1 Tax=Myxococcus stipitatus TaxID=83455 RepID=UPI0030D4837F
MKGPWAQAPWFPREAWKSSLARVVFVFMTWWALCDGDLSSLTFGVPVMTAVLVVSFMLSPPRRYSWRLIDVVRFGVFFLAGSVQGGIDVARRALAPGMPISPVFIRYRLRLPPGAPCTVFRITLSLMPGTLNADVLGDELVVHSLVDRGEVLHHELEDLERRVSRLFGLAPPPPEATHA